MPPLRSFHDFFSPHQTHHTLSFFFSIQEEDVFHLSTSYKQSNKKNKKTLKNSLNLCSHFVPFCFVLEANNWLQFTEIISVGEIENENQKQKLRNSKRIHWSSSSKNLHSRYNVQRRKRKGEENRNPYITIHCQLLNMQPIYLETHPKITGVTSFAFRTKATPATKQNPPTCPHVRLDQGCWSNEVSVVLLSALASFTVCAISRDFWVSSQVQVLVLSPKEEDLLVLQLEEETLGVAKNVGFSWPAMITRIFSS